VFVTRQVDEKTDMLVVKNATVNYNANGVANVNTAGNVNTTINSNENTNSEIDTSDWLTYTNSEYGYTFEYPKDWTVEEVYNINPREFDNWQAPLREVCFNSPENIFRLVIGIKLVVDDGSLGVGASPAGDTWNSIEVQVGRYLLPAIQDIYEGKMKGFYVPSPGQTTQIGNYNFGALIVDELSYDDVDLLNTREYYIILEMLRTLEL